MWNVEGAKTTFERSQKHHENFDLLLLSETFATKSFEIENFTCVHSPARQPAKGRPIGGLTIANNKRFRHSAKELYNSEHILLVSLSNCTTKLMLCYFQPAYNIGNVLNEIENALDYLEDKHPVIVCGDFNCRIDYSNQRGVDLLAFFSANDFECLNDPTKETYVAHNGWSTIDLISTRNTGQSFTEVVPTHITKHHMVTAFLDLNPTHNPLKQPSIQKLT